MAFNIVENYGTRNCTVHNHQKSRNTIHEVKIMDKNEMEKQQQRKCREKFNSVTRKATPQNQNQTHNSKKEGIGPINQKR